jgi:hypothetical protein
MPLASSGTPRRLVQIYDGGAMASSPDHFFLANPVEIDGAEAEGGLGVPVVDTTQTIVVDVLGHAPAPGDILTAYAVGGRWVAERGGSRGGSFPCAPCAIPEQDLTVSWVNSIIGNGSTLLSYSPTPPAWTSGCSNGLLYKLLCTGGQLELRVIYFATGPCPTGTQQYCSNLRVAPYGLTLASFTCSPFAMTVVTTTASCPVLINSGYSQFTVTV